MRDGKVKERLQELCRPTGEEDLLTIAYPKPRFDITLKQAVAALVVVGVVVSGLILSLFWDSSSPSSSGMSSELRSGSISSGHSSPSPAENSIVVSVVGAVEQPGVHTLSPTARVVDALEKAHPVGDANIEALNLAQKLNDGEQIKVPRQGEEGAQEPGVAAAGGSTTSDGTVSLNSATLAELESLPGVGKKTAEAIIAHREASGGFRSVEELLNVKGIGPAKFATISPHIRL
ncbi:hypothetical protein GP475_09030 [Corynebacterium poyangense]|uniref:Helix-hairpin-helix DNA-binding motif class 1 domain-containing protein n=1 Tax=Corynebacterium poyangense TaxID=2684405 RepID=A0A7H0SQE5_9CORY|nr:helix-hairpin-helix domain-containing protein [Corynebacterium poyangense]QNQ90770.1 hypothetical protein GP475_09030 [Corynebacterium poyangense]